MPVPTVSDFSLAAMLADAYYLVTQTSPIVLYAIGLGIGVLVIGLVTKALKEAM